MNALEVEMPYASNLICIWHINKAIRGWLAEEGRLTGVTVREARRGDDDGNREL